MIEIICKTCALEFSNFPSNNRKYCSHKCYSAQRRGKSFYKPTQKHKDKLRRLFSGKGSYLWKGDSVGYVALHEWVRKQLGKPSRCKHCKTTEDRMYHWANISGQYKRDLTDWIRLCIPCHQKFDDRKRDTVTGRFLPK